MAHAPFGEQVAHAPFGEQEELDKSWIKVYILKLVSLGCVENDIFVHLIL